MHSEDLLTSRLTKLFKIFASKSMALIYFNIRFCTVYVLSPPNLIVCVRR